MDLPSFHGLCACEILYAQGRIIIGCTKTKGYFPAVLIVDYDGVLRCRRLIKPAIVCNMVRVWFRE